MPREVVIFAIEAEEMAVFSEKCTPAVKKTIPKAVDMVLREVGVD
jgi:Ni,Fe-hydrogenase maturation factor